MEFDKKNPNPLITNSPNQNSQWNIHNKISSSWKSGSNDRVAWMGFNLHGYHSFQRKRLYAYNYAIQCSAVYVTLSPAFDNRRWLLPRDVTRVHNLRLFWLNQQKSIFWPIHIVRTRMIEVCMKTAIKIN